MRPFHWLAPGREVIGAKEECPGPDGGCATPLTVTSTLGGGTAPGTMPAKWTPSALSVGVIDMVPTKLTICPPGESAQVPWSRAGYMGATARL
jgi:hypothetical protein